MTIYLFKHDDQYVERDFRMGECPTQIEIEGKSFKRVYTSPNISFATPQSDDAKIQEEIDFEAKNLGMRGIVPLKHQSKKRQLQDLKFNKMKFKDSMDEANEKSVAKMRQKQKSIIENKKPLSHKEIQDRFERNQTQKP